MAHSDRGHLSVLSSGPAVSIAIKKERREGCLRHAFPEAPPPLTRMKKKQKEEKAMIRTSHSLPPEAATKDAVDPTSRPETSSAGPNATRRQSVVPVVKTRLLFRAPPIPDHNRRTGLPSRLPSISIAGFTVYTPNLHSARMGAMSKGQPVESGKESLTRRRSYALVPAPLFISEGFFFFLRTHPLEVRWSWNCGAVVMPVVFSDPWTPSLRISPIFQPVTSVVPIGDTREENMADKEIGPAGPQTIPSP